MAGTCVNQSERLRPLHKKVQGLMNIIGHRERTKRGVGEIYVMTRFVKFLIKLGSISWENSLSTYTDSIIL